MHMTLQNKLIILTAIVSVLFGPVEFLIELMYEGWPSNWAWVDVLNPWFFGALFSTCTFGFLAVWIIYGIVWAIYQLMLLTRNFKHNSPSKNATLITAALSFLLGPLLFLADISLYGTQSEHWYIVESGNFVVLSVELCMFVWLVYTISRWVFLPPCLWIVKVFRKFVK
jgi:hypothetical protein